MPQAPEVIIEKIDELGVIHAHNKEILSLEEAQAKKILAIYKRVRQDLRDRLDLLGASYAGQMEAQHVRGILVQVESGILELKQLLQEEMSQVALDTALKGIAHTTSEIIALEKLFEGRVLQIDIQAALLAESTKALKLKQYQSSMDRYGADLVDRMNRILVDAVVMQLPYHQTVSRISGATGLMASEAYRVHRIVRTELHSIYDMSRLNTLQEIKKEQINDLEKISIDPLDSRTALDSIAVMGQIRPLNEPFRFKGQVTDPKTGESKFIEVKPFMNHPNRPNDRGSTAPYRKVWAKGLT